MSDTTQPLPELPARAYICKYADGSTEYLDWLPSMATAEYFDIPTSHVVLVLQSDALAALSAQAERHAAELKKQAAGIELFKRSVAENAIPRADAYLRQVAAHAETEAASVREANAILTAEVAELRAYAERYMFLRDTDDAAWRPYALRHDRAAADADALVDAARAKEGGI